MISQLGAVEEQSIFQAQGKKYSIQSLLANDVEYLNFFIDGQFATLYLSPKDYHRIHMPYGATLMKMVHVPGKLFSVNPTTVAHVSNIFAKNERVICYFKAPDIGVFAVILVGATVVGSIKTAWHGVVNKKRPKNIRYWYYEHQPVHLFKAEEMGQFLLGSTVILLFEKKSIQFVEQWQAKTLIKMGEAMGNKI